MANVVVLLICFVCVTLTMRANAAGKVDTIDCPDQIGLMANPSIPCDHWFYICYEWVGYRRECPDDLFFNPELNECDSWYNVPACSGKTRTTSLFNGTTPNPPELETVDPKIFDCKHKDDKNYADPLSKTPYCSERYFTCNFGNGYTHHCPNGTVFDPSHDRCDYSWNVFECTGSTPLPTTTLEPVTHERVDFDCSTVGFEGIHADPHEKCSRHYIVCGGGIAYRLPCPSDLRYNPETHSCQNHNDIFDCTGIHKTTEAPAMHNETVIPFTFKCTGKVDGKLYADLEEPCNTHYFICATATEGWKMPCPPGLYFDEKKQLCTWKRDVPACSKFFTRRHGVSRPIRLLSAGASDTIDERTTMQLSLSTVSIDVTDNNGSTIATDAIDKQTNNGSTIATDAIDNGSTIATDAIDKQTTMLFLSTISVNVDDGSTIATDETDELTTTNDNDTTDLADEGSHMGRLRSTSNNPRVKRWNTDAMESSTISVGTVDTDANATAVELTPIALLSTTVLVSNTTDAVATDDNIGNSTADATVDSTEANKTDVGGHMGPLRVTTVGDFTANKTDIVNSTEANKTVDVGGHMGPLRVTTVSDFTANRTDIVASNITVVASTNESNTTVSNDHELSSSVQTASSMVGTLQTVPYLP